MNKGKRLMSGIVAVLMVVSLLASFVIPATAVGDYDEEISVTGLKDMSALPNITNYPAGTTNYQVDSRAGMEKLRDLVFGGNALAGVTIYQTADIDMGWEPFVGIGSIFWTTATSSTDKSKPFSGTFDGNGFVFENLYVLTNSAGRDTNGGAGLFAYMSGGAVKNVGIASGLVVGNQWTGAVVGSCIGGTAILNCWNAATIVGGKSGTAGIVGRAAGGGCKIVNCYNLGMMMTATSKVAGIAGWINDASTYVANSYNAGEFVSAFKSVDKNQELHEYSVIVNADFKSARGTDNANNYYVTGRGKTGSVAELIASGTVLSGYGFEVSAIQTNDQATGVDPSALTDSGETGLAAKLNSGDLSAGAVEGYTIGFEASNIGYPVLTYKKGDVTVVKRVAHTTTNVNGENATWKNASPLYALLYDNRNGGFGAAGTHPMDDLEINSANDLFVLALATISTPYTSVYGNGNISLANDIDMNKMNLLPVKEYTPIGAGSSGVWTGTLDGKNHVIKNWRLYSALCSGNACSGLIASTDGNATIKNLGMVDFYYRYQHFVGQNDNSYYTYPAAIVDRVYGNTFTADNCFATGTFEFLDEASKCPNNLGAVYGRSWGVTINVTNCWSNIKTIGENRSDGARVIGSNSGGTITGTRNNYYFANTTYNDGKNPIAHEPYQTGIKDAEIINNNSAIAAYLNEKTPHLWTVCADGYVTWGDNTNAIRKLVVLETIGGHVAKRTNYYAKVGEPLTYDIPTGYEPLDDPSSLPQGAETGSFTMPNKNVVITFSLPEPDWSIVEKLIAEYEALDLDGLVDGDRIRDQLGYMKKNLENKAIFTDDEALDYIGGYAADDASFDKSLKKGYYPRYSLKDRYGTQKITAFAISSKEDWQAAITDSATSNFSGITLHFTNDVDMGNVEMTPLCYGTQFNGTIDGHGHVINNLNVTMNDPDCDVGLVSMLAGRIQNLGIASGTVSITGLTKDRRVGAFAGAAWGGAVIRNCWNGADVSTKGYENGSVAGIVGGGLDGSTVDGCFNIGTISGETRASAINDWAQTKGMVYNSFNNGTLKTNTSIDGNGTASDGTTKAYKYKVVVRYHENGTGEHCNNTYAIDGIDGRVDSILGKNDKKDTALDSTNILSADAYSTGELAWKLNNGYVEGKGVRTYYTLKDEKTVFGTAENQVVKITLKQGETVQTVYKPAGSVVDLSATWDNKGVQIPETSVWKLTDISKAVLNGSELIVPMSDVEVQLVDCPLYSNKSTTPDAESIKDWGIASSADWLAAITDSATSDFSDITLHFRNDVDMENTNMEPLGVTAGFSGTIDGHGYVLKNVYQKRTLNGSNGNAGLVSALNGTGKILNLGIASGLFDITFSAHPDRDAIGAFAGISSSGSLFRNCWNAATVKGTSSNTKNYCVSGLVGRGGDGSTIDGCFNIGTISTGDVRSSDLNNWAQCAAGKPGCYVYNSFGAGTLSGTDQNLVYYNNTGIKQACEESRFPLYNTYSTGTLIIVETAANAIPEGYWNPNTTNRLGADAYSTGELAYKLNTGYVAGKGVRTYYTLKGGKTVFGTPADQPHRITLTLPDATVKTYYTDSDGHMVGTDVEKTLNAYDWGAELTTDMVFSEDADYTAIGVKGVKIEGASLSLGGDIGVNYFVTLPDEVANSETAYMQFTVNGITSKIPVNEAGSGSLDGKPCKVFTYRVNSIQMVDTITAQLIVDETTKSHVIEYSVQQYARNILRIPENSQTIKLVKALVNYGAYAQKRFTKDTDLANSFLNAAFQALTKLPADALDAFAPTKSGSVTGLDFNGSTLMLDSCTAIRHYFTVTEGKIGDYTFKLGDTDLTPVKKGSKYYVEIPNITAANLGTMFTLTATKGNESLAITYGAMSHVKNKLDKETTSVEEKNVLKALYLYYQAAVAYKQANP